MLSSERSFWSKTQRDEKHRCILVGVKSRETRGTDVFLLECLLSLQHIRIDWRKKDMQHIFPVALGDAAFPSYHADIGVHVRTCDRPCSSKYQLDADMTSKSTQRISLHTTGCTDACEDTAHARSFTFVGLKHSCVVASFVCKAHLPFAVEAHAIAVCDFGHILFVFRLNLLFRALCKLRAREQV